MKFNQVRRSQTRIQRKGAATVEMAMVAPVILMLIFGSVEFARMMMVRQALTNAGREACRHACLVTTSKDSEAINVVHETLQGVVYKAPGNDVVSVKIEPAFNSPPPSGTNLVTTIEVDCAKVSWLPPVFYAGAKIRVTSSMFRE